MSRDFQRPMLQPTYVFDWIVGSDDAGSAQRIAQETSWALLAKVRGAVARKPQDAEVITRVLQLANEHGIDDIAELWSSAGPDALAGQLWRIYLLHRTASGDPAGTADVFSRGIEIDQTIHTVVAGVAEPVTPDSILALCNEVLRGVFVGDFGVALDRAASYCRVMSLGAVQAANAREFTDEAQAQQLTTRSARYASLATDFSIGARRWREGSLH